MGSDRFFFYANKAIALPHLNPNQKAIALSTSSKILLCQRYLNSNKKRGAIALPSNGFKVRGLDGWVLP
jgi:hypothetical protein